MELKSGAPHYAVELRAGVAPEQRLAREVQSTAANDLLRRLRAESGVAGGAASKAHARAISAAAVIGAGRVGIDVEYLAPGRPIGAIARFLLGASVRDDAAAYRAFTFHEAYFKAFGAAPERELARDVAESLEPLAWPRAGLGVLHAAPSESFVLTLVWSGESAPERLDL